MKTPGRTCWANGSSIPDNIQRVLLSLPRWPGPSLVHPVPGRRWKCCVEHPGPRPVTPAPDLATQITFNRSLWPPISDRLLWNDWHNPQSAGVIKRSHWVLSCHKPGVFTNSKFCDRRSHCIGILHICYLPRFIMDPTFVVKEVEIPFSCLVRLFCNHWSIRRKLSNIFSYELKRP